MCKPLRSCMVFKDGKTQCQNFETCLNSVTQQVTEPKFATQIYQAVSLVSICWAVLTFIYCAALSSCLLLCFLLIFISKNLKVSFQLAVFFAGSRDSLSYSSGQVATVFLQIQKLTCSSLFCILSFLPPPQTEWHSPDIFFPHSLIG